MLIADLVPLIAEASGCILDRIAIITSGDPNAARRSTNPAHALNLRHSQGQRQA